MCGIAGSVGVVPPEGRHAVGAMLEWMIARGPDDVGLDEVGGAPAVVLGCRRLAIIDPSPDGHQPMLDPDRQTAIVFNGMIYNFRELRARLEAEGERFRSRCDTEVVLRAYGRFGEDCVRRLRGMFGFAIWDGRRRQLFLARDRLGIKPLYYRADGETLLFASQVKALLASGLVDARLSAEAVRSYLAFGAVADPLTALEGARALPAGCTASVRDGEVTVRRYWEPPGGGEEAIDGDEARRALLERLGEAVAAHLVSDAPLGVFLSGGADSSVVAALASRHTERLRTVSVVFDEADFSEGPYSERFAAELDCEHVSVRLRPGDLLDALDGAFAAMDQPSFDGLNTYVVSQAASATGLKVALSGLGGDELFDGYGYRRRVAMLERARALPRPLARLAARALPPAIHQRPGEKLRAWLTEPWERGRSYELLRRLFLPKEVAVLSPNGSVGSGPRPAGVDPNGDPGRQVAALDLTNYTRNVLLRDTDAMSMAHSLEVRVPFLDHELVEWTLRLPPTVRGQRKRLLVAAVRGLVPPYILDRRKQGFLLPFPRWLQGELRSEVEERLRRPEAPLADILDGAAMADVWERWERGLGSWLEPWSLYALCRWAETVESPKAAVR